MSAFDEQVSTYLRALRGDKFEDAYHSLLELGPNVLPSVVTNFRSESDPRVRSALVKIAWQTRSPQTIAFLQEALEDPVSEVWKEALDGLVTLGGETALNVVRQARARVHQDRSPWFDAAEQQIVSSRLVEHSEPLE